MKKTVSLLFCFTLLMPFLLCGCMSRYLNREPDLGRHDDHVTTPSPDGEAVTEGFMTAAGFTFDLSLLDNKTYRLKFGEYMGGAEAASSDEEDEEAPGADAFSEVTFYKDMTCTFSFSDYELGEIERDYDYTFAESNMLMAFLENAEGPAIVFTRKYSEEISFVFDTEGRLWILLDGNHPVYDYFVGLYEPVPAGE